MKRIFETLIAFALFSVLSVGQSYGQLSTVVGQTVSTQLNPATSVTSQGGAVTNPSSNFVINITAGPVVCPGGDLQYMASTQMTLPASSTNLLVFNCQSQPSVYAKQAVTGPGSNGTTAGAPASVLFAIPGVELPLATVVCNATACGNGGNGSITDNRVAGIFPIISDWSMFVPETACGGAVTGTAGSGNATDIVALSGGARVFRLSNTNASGSTNTFTCIFNVPSKITAGHGFTINDITFLVSTQTTQPTSVTLPTLKSFSPPAAVDPETANSATFVTAGGTLTLAPTSAQFAAYTAVAAGQFFSLKISLGTPVLVNTDLQTFQLVIPFVQSASAAGVQETPGFYVHGSMILN